MNTVPRLLVSRVLLTGLVLVGADLAAAQSLSWPSRESGARAQADDARAAAIATAESTDVDERALLQDLYRDLYDVQLRMARASSESTIDSLLAVRSALLTEIGDLARRVEAERAQRKLPPPPPPLPSTRGADDMSVLVDELERIGGEVDWESVSKSFEINAKSVGEGLAIIGEQLKNLQVEVDENRVRVDTGSGGRFTFTIPPELKNDISQGIREMSLELGRVLDDSTRHVIGKDLRVLLDELPEDLGTRLRGRAHRPKKVIAESVFQLWKDFEIADDEAVRGDVLIIGGDAYVAGEVQGNVYVLFGDLFVEGRGDVAQDAISLGGRVRVDDDSEVHGRRFDVSTVLPGLGIGAFGGSGGMAWVFYSVRVAVLALLLVLGFALAGHRLESMVEHGEARVGRSLVSGTLWFSITLGVVVVASVGLAISIIGIPVVIVLAGAFAIVVLLAYFVGCQVVGDRLLDLFGGHGPTRPWQIALVGLAVLEIPALMSTVFIGAGLPSEVRMLLTGLDVFVKFLAVGIGFGAVVATRIGGLGNGVHTEAAEGVALRTDA